MKKFLVLGLVASANIASARAWGAPDRRQALLEQAMKLKGRPYRWNGDQPSGFDCSGFVTYVIRQVKKGVKFPKARMDAIDYRNDLAKDSRIDCEHAKPGDLVFFSGIPSNRPGHPHNHVGIIIHPGKDFVTAQNRHVGVAVQPFYRPSNWSRFSPECFTNRYLK